MTAQTEPHIGEYPQAWHLVPHQASAYDEGGADLGLSQRLLSAGLFQVPGYDLQTLQHGGSSPLPSVPQGLQHPEALLAAGHQAYSVGNYEQALKYCQSVYEYHPNRTDLLLLVGAVYYQMGNYTQCLAFNDRCIVLDPGMAEAHANLANSLQQLGNFDLAIAYYQSALRQRPGFTDAINNLASALVQKGAIPAALQCYQAAIAINPNLVNVHNNLGDLWRAQGPIGQGRAQQCYAAALQVDKGYAPAWRGLGDSLRETGDATSAVACYKEAVRLRGGHVDAFTGMGTAYKDLKQRDEAAACFQQAALLRPTCALTLGNLAGVYYEQGRLDAAIATYKEALARDAAFPEAYNNLGNALREAGRPEEAVQCYTMCIQVQLGRSHLPQPLGVANPTGLLTGMGGILMQQPGIPKGLLPGAGSFLGGASALGSGLLGPASPQALRLSVAYNNLGGILKLQGRAQEAIACYEHVALLQPESAEAHANLASAYKDAARQEVAIGSYKKALVLRPDFPEAYANLVHSLQCVCEWRDRGPLFARLETEVRRDLASGRLPPVQPFHAMAYPFSADLALAISAKYAEYCLLQAARLGVPKLPHPPGVPLGAGERLRVGYVSSDFGNHPLSHLMGSVFGMHDRTQVEVFCYALSASDSSEWRGRIEAEAEHFTDLTSWAIGDIARRISADGIHVLINLNGYTKGARNEIFALQPAPVQASYMGFPATTGAPFLPYLITDATVAPPEHAHCYSEHLALMPHCYFVNDYKRAHLDILEEDQHAEGLEPVHPKRAEHGLPEDRVVFSCSNQLYKYDPETFTTWCNILRRVPRSVLWLLRFPPYGEPRIRAAAAAQGIDPTRIIFTDVASKPVHIKRSGLADVFLDTPLCNAHTTGCDVLWGGCPIVTLPLERMASRVAASLAAATGLGAYMVVNSQAEYEERAVVLGSDHRLRLSLRRRLKAARLSCPLFDTAQWVRDFERVLFKLWDIHCEGNGPRSFAI